LAQSQITNLVSDLAGKASLGAANAFTVGGHVITNAATAVIPLVVKGASGQSANMLEIQNSAGSTAVSVAVAGNASFASGNFVISSIGSVSTSGSLNSSSKVRAGSTGSAYNGVLEVTATGATLVGQVIRGAASQSANLQEWQNSAGTIVANMQAGGNLKASNVATLNSLAQLAQANSGGVFIMARQTAAYSNPGANSAALYFRDGTTTGTLKLVVRAGASGAETTILDNIPQ
jgi:hypothetical protein